MKRGLRLICAAAALYVAMLVSSAQAASPESGTILSVPQRSQFDGTKWAASDCGPTSLGMILSFIGDNTPTVRLRERANQLMNNYDPDNGTRIQDLAAIAQEHGLSINGPTDGGNLGHWIPAELRAELKAGRPVFMEVAFYYLPNQRLNRYVSDHFIVLVGTDGSDFIYNDPADAKAPGYHQRMTEAELLQAWGKAKRPFLAFSVGRGSVGQVRPAALPSDPMAAPAVVVPLHDDTPAEDTAVLAAAPEETPVPVQTGAATAAATAGDSPFGLGILQALLALMPFGHSWAP